MSDPFSVTEIVGYLASLLVLVSFLMRNLRTLRIVNCVGCAAFIVYGFMLAISWPIVITNVAIVVINLVYLLKPKKV